MRVKVYITQNLYSSCFKSSAISFSGWHGSYSLGCMWRREIKVRTLGLLKPQRLKARAPHLTHLKLGLEANRSVIIGSGKSNSKEYFRLMIDSEFRS